MASLLSSGRLGNTSTSSLIKSATSLATQMAVYEDNYQASVYAASAKDDASYGAYSDYLSSRIDVLRSSGSITDASKALSLSNSWRTATNSNISSTIQRENIQVMSGNATLTDKYNVVASEYARAASIGDMATAQSLESQAYSISQSIQYQAQQADAASKTLQEAAVSYQGDVVDSLDNGLKELNSAAKNLSEADFNTYSQQFVKQNADAFQKIGVVLPDGAQPNYFDIVQGIVGAKYNALVLKAQAEAPINAVKAGNYAQDASFLNDGTTTISTLGGNLTLGELKQAASDPTMFAYNQTSGKYERTTQTGYQVVDGQTLPTYSGIVSSKAASQFYFLSPTETAQLKSLGFNITAKLNSDGSVGTGITAQYTGTGPDWVTKVFGKNGEAQFFNQDGNLTFKVGSSFLTLGQDEKGLSGFLQHMPDGSIKGVGGAYGFDSRGLVALLSPTTLQSGAPNQPKLTQDQPLALPKLSLAPPMTAPPLKMSAPNIAPVTSSPQQTISPQRTVAPSPLAVSTQTTAAPQSTASANLNTSGGGGIPLGRL